MKNKSDIAITILLIGLIVVLFFINISTGTSSMNTGDVLAILKGETPVNPSWTYIVESRLNRSLTAIGAGGALAISGLILQVFFRNPLAGPGVLGITSGASLGIATVILGGFSTVGLLNQLGLITAGVTGALSVLLLLLLISRYVKNAVTLLVAGLMFGYFTSALINVLFLWANETQTRAYVIWGLGSFEGLSNGQLSVLLGVIFVVTLGAFFLVRALNAYVLGSEYAASIGINVKTVRVLIILITGVLAAVVTVFCGPISFVGIAVPQLVRFLVKSKNHAIILPITFLGGSLLALTADLVVRQSGNSLPLNTVTAIIGAPVIVAVIINMNKKNAQF